MAPDKADMLKHLEPVTRPWMTGSDKIGTSSNTGQTDDLNEVNEEGFDSMIQRAMSGQWRGPDSLELPQGLQLTQEETQQLNLSVDQLAATGSRRAVVIVDQRAFAVNVRDRAVDAEITNSTTQGTPGIIRDIDSAAITRTPGGSTAQTKPAVIANGALRSINQHVWSQGVSRILSELGENQTPAENETGQTITTSKSSAPQQTNSIPAKSKSP